MESVASIGNSHIESGKVRVAIPFEVVQYGSISTNETYDVYGTDLPKGIQVDMVLIFLWHIFTS